MTAMLFPHVAMFRRRKGHSTQAACPILSGDFSTSAAQSHKSSSPFHGTGELLLLFVLTQFPRENRFTLFPELP
ncbi:hypothetical protein DBIPINDM_003938 [Mesorhizobium sp. AR02]|uniref:hypothetical protein n=1 Tax=Mesorhizobium sp. AR02 TaxID=2865837 RepID=UPI00216069CF|nr:hypothetical protein [Mesorhizobium sp. AR02]UVK50754.1 hypothetical protein DBIPINDM_003938 [Mesorhizobium sp. AR02]